jgi:magnesium chelatase accessory protein
MQKSFCFFFFRKRRLFLLKNPPGMQWNQAGKDWPNRESSRFIKLGNLVWHVQTMGNGPALLLAHGTGASTHSWRDLMPALAKHFTVVAPDLQGHGFTGSPPSYQLTVNDMAAGLSELMHAMGCAPEVAVGHSAGAAILARMVLDGGISPKVLVALNGAMLPIPGLLGQFWENSAKMLALIPAVPWFFSWRARQPGAVEKLIDSTGSKIDAQGKEYYARLLHDPVHVGNVLAMMANWNLQGLQRDLPSLPCRLVLVVADNDRAVPPKVAQKIAALVPGAKLILQHGYGHLSHEEAPGETAALILQSAEAAGVAA